MSSDYYKEYDTEPGFQGQNGHRANERVGLLSGSQYTLPIAAGIDDDSHFKAAGGRIDIPRYALKHLVASFAGGGIIACLALLLSLYGMGWSAGQHVGSGRSSNTDRFDAYAAPWAGSSVFNNYPPPSPTNEFPGLFPTNIGYPGVTVTGAEPGIIATAPTQPLQTGAAELVAPAYASFPEPSSDPPTSATDDRPFNLFRSWGNLSPWYSVPRGAFGIDEGAEPPAECRIRGLHLLHRHGARYPTSGEVGPAVFAIKLHKHADQWEATGSLAFLNDWTYKLGAEVLTPFGRQQMYDLGVAMRLKYGFLLESFTAENKLPVFRTESQDRMHASAVNFALGFFAWPLEGKYEQLLTIEASGFNNTLAPYDTCPNANDPAKATRSSTYLAKWANIYLKDAQQRLQAEFKPTEGGQGFELTIKDVHAMQQMCAYETVALGFSKFCELFTEDEWEGFNYYLDLTFWYDNAFGSPVGRVQGLGYIQELVSRLTHTPIETYNSSVNSTLDGDETTFPLNNVLYVDATHEVVVLNVLTALNLTTLAASGPLPADHIPANRSFRSADLAPFGTNIQFQLLSCDSSQGYVGDTDAEPTHIRVVVNDGPVPLSGIQGCPPSSSGLCPLPAFIEGQKVTIREVDWNWGCHGDWTVPPGDAWETDGGWYPPPN